MPKFKSPVLGAAIAAALASTTGYCVITKESSTPPPPPPPIEAPTNLLPAPVDPEPADANG